MTMVRADVSGAILIVICAVLIAPIVAGHELISATAVSFGASDLDSQEGYVTSTTGAATMPLTLMITPTAGPNGSISPNEPVPLLPNRSQVFEAHPNAGCVVEAWSVDGVVVQFGGASYTVTGDQASHCIHVTFRQVKYTITPSAGANGSISPNEPVSLLPNRSQVFKAHPNAGYAVDTWSLDDTVVQVGGATYTITGDQADHCVHVTFKQVEYTITPSAGPNGSISPGEPIPLCVNDVQVFDAHPTVGYTVDTWSLDGTVVQMGGTAYAVTGDQADHAVYVTFKQVRYTITPFIGGHGAIDPGSSVTVLPGSSLTLVVTPETGYRTDMWFLDGSVAQIGGNTYELFDISADHEVGVSLVALLAYDLGEINFDSPEEFGTQITHNNIEGSSHSEKDRVHVERLEGQNPDPQGVMVMHSLRDLDPDSPTFGLLVNARAKATFAPTGENEILVRFRYLFSASGPGVEMIVYVSDSPELLDHDDPSRDEHYLEIGRLPAPPAGRPGSAGSGRAAVFEKIAWIGALDCTQGVWIELELIEPEVSNSVVIDSFGLAVQCFGICLDINWDNLIDVTDFLKVIGECGRPAAGELACLEGVFSADGVVDSLDTVSWDWALSSNDRLLSVCKVPLVDDIAVAAAASPKGVALASVDPVPLPSLPSQLNDLLIVGKRGVSVPSGKLQDGLYIYATDRLCTGYAALAPDRGNIRLVQDPAGGVYVINSEQGLLRLDGSGEVVIPRTVMTLPATEEPRYGQPATIYLGIQERAGSVFGRPVLDVALDADYAYVLPVVVSPVDASPYLAAARLRLGDGVSYQIDRLYDDPPLPNDNQYRDSLRELEIDSDGNVYVLNAHSLNESDILWRYRPDGTVERVDLGRPGSENYCRAPTAMHMSTTTSMLYFASSQENEADRNTSILYGYSTSGTLVLQRSVAISGMQHVAGMAEDPTTGRLWVVGFSMYYVPTYPNPTVPAFYYPCLAAVDSDAESAEALPFDDSDSSDLALPLSILWTGK